MRRFIFATGTRRVFMLVLILRRHSERVLQPGSIMAAAQCPGDGWCLKPNYGDDDDNDITYMADEICVHRCKPVYCPNHVICEDSLCPAYILSCHGGRCMNCNIVFGKNLKIVELSDNEECFICFDESKTAVEMPAGCGHRVCVHCFRKIFFPVHSSTEEEEDEEEGEFETSRRACPICRRSHTPYWVK